VGNTSYFIKLADSGSEEPEPTPAAVEPSTPENGSPQMILAWYRRNRVLRQGMKLAEVCR
jgi:hypothetical protein